MKRFFLQIFLMTCLLSPIVAQNQGMTLSIYEDAPVGCSAFRCEDGKLRILLFSRQFDADYPVTLDLPQMKKKQSVTVTTLTGPDPSTRLDYKLQTSTITLHKGKPVIVPAFSAMLLEFGK